MGIGGRLISEFGGLGWSHFMPMSCRYVSLASFGFIDFMAIPGKEPLSWELHVPVNGGGWCIIWLDLMRFFSGSQPNLRLSKHHREGTHWISLIFSQHY